MKTKALPFAAFAIVTALAVTLLGLFSARDARACEICNLAFAQELLGERSQTLAGQELLRKMAAQAALGIGAPSVAAPTAAAGAPAAARSAPQKSTRLRGAEFERVFGQADFIEIIRRDEGLRTHPTSVVPQDVTPDKEFTITLEEGKAYIGQGVIFDGFTTNGGIPGPLIVVTEGDIVRMNVVNRGNIPHGASIHAAYAQTSKYLGNIPPGETRSFTFRATVPGVFMYHCAPGGHAIPMHVMFGQYGMMVVRPRDQKFRMEEQLGRPPDVSIFLLQHEIFASGRDAVEGRPLYTAWNGQVFRYVREPIVARPGDFVRVYYLNVGPTRVSTFHLVGIVWDYVYWQGHPANRMTGGQSVTSAPSDSWVIEFRVPPAEGVYLMVDHSLDNATRGAIGLLVADRNARTPVVVDSRGPTFTAEELQRKATAATRTISPFRPGSASERGSLAEVDEPVVFAPDVKEVTVRIIGNSFYPKVIEIEPGTRVRWINEELFTFMEGEFSGIHNAVGTSGPEPFATRLLGHAESDSFVFTKPGTHEYICAPHPYMAGRIIVREPAAAAAAATPILGWWLPVIAAPLALLLAIFATVKTLLRSRAGTATA
jgi:nitrite reductase (NO-forming)